MSVVVATTCISISSLDRPLWMQVEGGDDVQQEWLYHISITSLIFLVWGDAHVRKDTKKMADCFAVTEIYL
jgi:hypothetical protein